MQSNYPLFAFPTRFSLTAIIIFSCIATLVTISFIICIDGAYAACPCDCDNDGYDDEATCAGTDCDDNDPAIKPNSSEICDDTVDNNCDGSVDCADSECECVDNDSDGWDTCNPNHPCDTDGNPADPDDSNYNIFSYGEICDNAIDDDDDADVDCQDSECSIDNDYDNYYSDENSCGNDCNDANPNVNPGATEICDNSIDDDCDTDVDMADDDCDLIVQQEITSTGVYNVGGQVNATIECTSFTSAGIITITVHPGESHPQADGDSVKRWFEISSTANGTFTLTLTYQDSELGNEVEGNLKLWRYDDGWDGPYSGIIDGAANTITISNVNSFSDWVISDAGPQPPVMEWTTILFIAMGVLALGGFIWYRKQKVTIDSLPTQ